MYNWDEIQRRIFATESGGDYNALYNYQNRPDGRFSDVRLTEMPISDVLSFTNPQGEYASYVRGQVGRTATPVGAYQVVGSTLRNAVEALGIDPSTPFNQETQDRIGRWILENQGPQAWEGLTRGGNMNGLLGGGPVTASSMNPQQPQQNRFFNADMRDRLIMALQGMTLNPNQALIQTAAQGIQQRAAQRQTTEERNATAEWLESQGRSDLAGAVRSGGLSGAQAITLMQRQISGQDVPASFRALQLQAEQAGLEPGTPEYQEFMLYGGAAREELPAAFRSLHEQALAAGFEPGSPEYQQFMATRGAGLAAEARVQAENRADAQFALIAGAIDTREINRVIDNILNDPYLPNMIGPVQGLLPSVSADARRVQSLLDQLSGQAFLSARQALRGGGTITDFESNKAEEAFLRMQTAVTVEDFREGLEDFRRFVEAGQEKLRAQAGIGEQSAPATSEAAPSAPAASAAPSSTDPLGIRN